MVVQAYELMRDVEFPVKWKKAKVEDSDCTWNLGERQNFVHLS